MFQGYEQTLTIPFPKNGINLTSNNDGGSAKYLQNILLGNNNAGKVRYGTYLRCAFPFAPNRIFRSVLHGNSFLKTDGTSENIAYVNYLTVLPFINMETEVALSEVVGNRNVTEITINIGDLNQQQKDFLTKRIFEGVYFYIVQTDIPDGADISDVSIDLVNNTIKFNLPFPIDFFNLSVLGLNNFIFWFERAGIYKEGANNLFNNVPLRDDLDPNVIISSVNYQNYLLIANGVDPVLVYDGNTITNLAGDASVAIKDQVAVAGNNITVKVATNIKAEYEATLIIGSRIKLVSRDDSQEVAIINIVFTDVANNLTEITITCDVIPIEGVRNILYKKPVPPFNYLSVGHNRLWALAQGRPYLKQFRPPQVCQKVYFAARQASVFDWFNEATANIDFIDLSVNNQIPENIEVIKFFEGKMLFIGRHSTQIWAGNDPTANFDGQNISFGNFYLERVIPLGILQRSLCQEIPNNFAIISTFGKSFSFYLNKYGQIDYTPNFIDPIRDYLEAQLSFIENDRDYREMTTFFYPYNDLLGIRIKGECLIYQIKNNGFWSSFNENFADAMSFFYNEIDKNLYLGMSNGMLLTYADKVNEQIFTDYDITNGNNKKLIWRILYSWIVTQTTWHNSAIFLSATSLRELPVNVKVYENNSETYPIENEIMIKQVGSRFDAGSFFKAVYTYQPTEYAYKSIRFNTEAFMLEFNAFVEDMLIFDKAILAGGVQNAN